MKNKSEFICPICGHNEYEALFEKKGSDDKIYTLLNCRKCSLELITPVPNDSDLIKCYDDGYFKKRTDRGYNNYFDEKIRFEIERVFSLNLEDLDFFSFEKSLGGKKTSLDIGCAAGYFVNYLKDRGWDASGIDVSKECIDFAQKKLKVNAVKNDYMKMKFTKKFDLITLWATIEHLKNPFELLKKCYEDLSDNGMIIISTCRTGLNFKLFFGRKWRYYNFPEHMFFFSIKNIKMLLSKNYLATEKIITYGSGVGKSGSFLKKIADKTAKKFLLGDMMVLSAKKILK